MAQQIYHAQHIGDAKVDSGHGEIVLDGVIPSSWTTYTTGFAQVNSAGTAWAAQVRKTGLTQVTVRVFHRGHEGTIEYPKKGATLDIGLVLFGEA